MADPVRRVVSAASWHLVSLAAVAVLGSGALAPLSAQDEPRPHVVPDTLPRDPGAGPAHVAAGPSVPRAEATRQELEAILAGKSGPVSDAERRLVNERLKQGDFQPGDRIVLLVAGETALSDTFTVKPGKTVALPNLPDISLDGVLRSELTPYLGKQLGRYIRDVDLTATPLVRVAVLGAVGRPGFYNLPADALATDAITLAGGPAANADITKTMVQRGGAPLYTKDEMTEALQRGSSLDQLNVQSGDELVIGTKSEGIRGTLTTLGLVSGILFGVVAATRIF